MQYMLLYEYNATWLHFVIDQICLSYCTDLARGGFKTMSSGPRLKKFVHHCFRGRGIRLYVLGDGILSAMVHA